MRGQRYTTEKQRLDAFEHKFIPEPNTGCWLWTASLCRDGYGNFYDGKRVIGAHRFSWQTYKGEIPEGLHILHKCDTPACVNPDHLSLGTHRDNMNDSLLKGRNFFASKTHCKRGHVLSGENLYVRPDGTRDCYTCRQERHLRTYKKVICPAKPKTHCKRGHPLSGDNLIKTRRTARLCKACHNMHSKLYKQRSK